MSKRNTLDSFAEVLDTFLGVPEDECWNWPLSKDTNGYGHYRINKILCKAHRLSYLYFNQSLEKGLFVCHTCDNPSCVNPHHLFIGTNSDNMLDMYKKGRGNTVEKLAKKLNTDEATQIKNAVGTHQVIADHYGINRSMVGKIKAGKCWKNV